MDIPRIGYRERKWRRNVLLLLLAAALVTGATVFVSRLEPALPAVDRSSVWIDTVIRGPLILDVRGIGTLVPEDLRWVPALADAPVEQLPILPPNHATSTPSSLILTIPTLDLQ